MTGLVLHDGAISRPESWSDEATAYVDSDWAAGSIGAVPALVARDGALHWREDRLEIPNGEEADVAALACLLTVAADAVWAVRGAGAVSVVGRGVVAWAVRRMLSAPLVVDGARPDAAIDTTGDPRVLVESSRALADGGTLVLAGEPCGRSSTWNLYTDVHRRGLTLVGVEPPLGRRDGSQPPFDDARRLIADEPPSPVAFGAALGAATWYRLEAGDLASQARRLSATALS